MSQQSNQLSYWIVWVWYLLIFSCPPTTSWLCAVTVNMKNPVLLLWRSIDERISQLFNAMVYLYYRYGTWQNFQWMAVWLKSIWQSSQKEMWWTSDGGTEGVVFLSLGLSVRVASLYGKYSLTCIRYDDHRNQPNYNPFRCTTPVLIILLEAFTAQRTSSPWPLQLFM